MELIVGGAFQGKLKWAFKHYGYEESEAADAGKYSKADMEQLKKKVAAGRIKIITHVEEMVKAWLKQEKKPVEQLEELLAQNEHIIFIMDEIGSGIVPMDAFERKYREEAGRCGCFLAKRAERVIRVIYGSGTIIKDGGESL